MDSFRYIKTYLEKNFNVLWVALGLGCAYVTFGGMFLNNITGIYPIESSLVLRNLAGTLLAVILMGIYLVKKIEHFLSASKIVVAVLGVALALSCLLRYSSHLFSDVSQSVVFVGRLLELPLSLLLIMAWSENIMPRGFRASVVIYTLSLTWTAVLQLVLSFFQHVPFMVLYSALPLVSSGILAFAKVQLTSLEGIDQGEEESSAPLIQLQRSSQFVWYFGVLATFTFIAGQIVQETLSLQGNQFICQLSIVLGNCVAAIVLISQVKNLFNKNVHPKTILAITFLFAFALLSIMFSLSGTLDLLTITLFLFSKHLFMQFVTVLLWMAPFALLRKSWNRMSIFSLGFACMMGARVLSSITMLFLNPFGHIPTGLICCPVLIFAFVCCTASIVFVATNPPRQMVSAVPLQASEVMNVKTPRPFHNAVAALAQQYGLTSQEEQVMVLCAKGKNAQRVADEMVITVNTAKSHLRSIYAKVSVHSQQELIALVDDKVEELRESQEN